VTLAVADDGVVGFADWRREAGQHGGRPTIVVRDLVALTPDAARALWRVLGSFAPVAPTVRLTTSGGWAGSDVSRLVLPDHRAVTTTEPYLLRMLDVAGALDAARLAPVTTRVPFAVVDPRTPDLEGSWVLDVVEGAPRTTPAEGTGSGSAVDGGGPVFTAAGLALSYAGSQSTANLRLAGHLSGPTTYDATWDALWGGRQFHVRDAF
jgi:predicted acetyltransferase